MTINDIESNSILQLDRLEVWGHLKHGERYLCLLHNRDWVICLAHDSKEYHTTFLVTGIGILDVGDIIACFALPKLEVLEENNVKQ